MKLAADHIATLQDRFPAVQEAAEQHHRAADGEECAAAIDGLADSLTPLLSLLESDMPALLVLKARTPELLEHAGLSIAERATLIRLLWALGIGGEE